MRSLTEILDNKPYGTSTSEVIRKMNADPKYRECEFGGLMEDDDGKDFDFRIKYCYYEANDFYLGRCKRVVEYSIEPLGAFRMTDESLNTSVQEAIRFECEGVVFESGIKILAS